jgi:hypothetical protein
MELNILHNHHYYFRLQLDNYKLVQIINFIFRICISNIYQVTKQHLSPKILIHFQSNNNAFYHQERLFHPKI